MEKLYYYYMAIGMLAIIIHVILNYKYFLDAHPRKEIKDYRNYLSAILLYFISDVLWGMCNILHLWRLLYVDTVLYYITMGFSVIFCCRYIISFLRLDNMSARWLNIVGLLFCSVEISVLIINHFYPIFFRITEDGAYVSYFFRDCAFYAQVLMFGAIWLISTVVASRTIGMDRVRNRTISIFAFIMTLALLGQYCISASPFYSIGLMLGTLIIHVFIYNDELNYRMKKITKQNAQLVAEKEARKEMAEAKDAAEAASEAKTRFLQNMSHEIRTPLNAMFGFAQLLGLPDGSWTEEEKAQYNAYIYNSYRMLEMLVSDIIDIADSENGNYRIELSDVSVNSVCRNAVMSVEYRVPMNVRMYYTSDYPDDYIINSDERRIQQVLINFLTNACKNTQKGEIHLHCSKTERPGKVTFSVTDTGTGVPKEKADLIFNRFTKLNDFVQGSGLGLNICMVIANKLNGDIYLDTSYTEGARFVFVIDDGTPQPPSGGVE